VEDPPPQRARSLAGGRQPDGDADEDEPGDLLDACLHGRAAKITERNSARAAERSVWMLSQSRYAAPTIFSTVNAVVEVSRSADRPSAAVDAGALADGWRQATGTPVWGTPYGPFSNEKGQPVGENAIRAALATARR
jgi:hypothetical protein